MSLLILMYINEQYRMDRDYTRPLNRWGGVVSIVLPFLIYAVLETV